MQRLIGQPLLGFLGAIGIAVATLESSWAIDANQDDSHWTSLITAEELHARYDDPNLLVIDVRSPGEYAAGHLPGAINLPGVEWRTPSAAPGSGKIGQQIFRRGDGSVDVPRYEKFLGEAGLKPEHEVVVYGNFAGKMDGSLPAALLLKLGQKRVAFLDGIGVEEWQAAGYKLSAEPHKLPPTKYQAQPDLKRLWSYQDMVNNLDNPNVVFVDSRTPEEYAGTDLRGNKRGGHIPGAVLLNAEDFLDKASHRTIDVDEARKKIEATVSKDKTVVIYCQSGTRCSHKELIFKDLGYKNVVLYDASWQEWGNLEDSPVEKPEPSADAPAEQ